MLQRWKGTWFPLQFTSIDLGKEKLNLKEKIWNWLLCSYCKTYSFQQTCRKFCFERFHPLKNKQNKRNNFQVANKCISWKCTTIISLLFRQSLCPVTTVSSKIWTPNILGKLQQVYHLQTFTSFSLITADVMGNQLHTTKYIKEYLDYE